MEEDGSNGDLSSAMERHCFFQLSGSPSKWQEHQFWKFLMHVNIHEQEKVGDRILQKMQFRLQVVVPVLPSLLTE